MTAGDHLEWVEVVSQQQMHEWFLAHHDQQDGIWLVTFKKAVPDRYVPHDIVLDHLIAFGWCDGIARRIDEQRVRQLVSPRRTTPWAKSYKDRAERLIRQGQMHPSGMAAVESARLSGAWDEMNDVDALVVPADLAEALTKAAHAQRAFESFAPSTRRSILRWIASAKQPATRQRRIQATSIEASQGRAVKSHG